MQTTTVVDDHLKEQMIFTLSNHILDHNVEPKSISTEIKSILTEFKLKEIDLLETLSEKMKITHENVEIILKNSANFNLLEESCQFYKKIVENSVTKQKNFLNILILNHLLTNLQSSNIKKYLIYFNLFIIDMDTVSIYKIVLTHCLGLPNSIYEISIFLNEIIKKIHNQQQFQEVLKEFGQLNLADWELSILQYFLQLNNNKKHIYKKFKQIQLKTINHFENVKNKKVFNKFFDAIMHDDVEEFCSIRSTNNIDVDCSIINSEETSNYWPFGDKKQIKFIELAAFSKSIKVFKNLILNHAVMDDDVIDYAIAGGDYEIVRICEQNKCEVTLHSIEFSIRYYQNDIFKWLLENNTELINQNIGEIFHFTYKFSNPQAFISLFDYGYNLSSMNINMLYTYNQEWINYFITIEIVHDIIKHKLNLSACSKKVLYSAYVYLNSRGDLDQYKNQIIDQNYPNEFILDIYYNRYFSSLNPTKNSKEFMIFLIKNNIIQFSLFPSLFDSDIYHYHTPFLYDFIEFLRKEKYFNMLNSFNHNHVQKILTEYLLRNGWIYFVVFEKSELKKTFLKQCLDDSESTFSLQTEGFCYSCYYGDLYIVSNFLNKKYVDLNSKKYLNRQTPLILATRSGFIDIVNVLINDKRVDVNAFCDELHQTSFYYACENNYFEIVELLMKDERVDINIPNNEGKTPFLIACEKGFDKIVQILINKNQDFRLNKQAFNIAIENMYHKIVKIFIESNCNDLNKLIQNDELKILQNACFYSNLKTVQLLFSVDLLAKKTEEKNVKSNLLHLACINENMGIINFLKEKGFEINTKEKADDDDKIKCTFRKRIEYTNNQQIDITTISLLSTTIRTNEMKTTSNSDYHFIKRVNLNDYELINEEKLNQNDCLYFYAIRKINGKKILVNVITKDMFSITIKKTEILQKINHPAIIKFFGISNTSPLENCNSFKQMIFSFNEYYSPNMTLQNYMINERKGMGDQKFNLTKKYIILLGISHAMKYLHGKGYIYENLHPENIMLDENLHPKISNSKSEFNKPMFFNFLHELGVDIYAFGMLAYELITLKDPSENIEKIEFNEYVSNELKEIISNCLAKDPKNRPSFGRIFDFLINHFSSNELIERDEVLDYIDILQKSENISIFNICF